MRRRRISDVHVVAEVPSFESVAERHLDDVHAYLVYMTRNREVAEDLTAETFERALRQRRILEPRKRIEESVVVLGLRSQRAELRDVLIVERVISVEGCHMEHGGRERCGE